MLKFIPDIEDQKNEVEPNCLPLIHLTTSYWIPKVLASAIELNLFSKLSSQHLSFQNIATILGLQVRPAEMLLTACVALGLLQIKEGQYTNSPLAEKFLVKGLPTYFGEIVALIDRRLYPAWGHLTESLKSNLPLKREDLAPPFATITNLEEKGLLLEAFREVNLLSGNQLPKALDLSRFPKHFNDEENQKKPTPLPLLKLATSFWCSKALGSAVELGLFTELSGRKVDLKQAEKMLGLQPRPTEMILTWCAELELLQVMEGQYSNTPLAERFLVKGRPYYFGEAVKRSERRLYRDWGLLTQALKTNQPQCAKQWESFDDLYHDREEKRLFLECIHGLSIQTGRELAKKLDISNFHRLLDVGGGSGAFCIELLRRFPHLQPVLFDLPPALQFAHEKIYAAGYSKLIDTYPGDFFKERLPQGCDVILLSLILHSFTPEQDRAILKKCHEALPAGGALIIVDLMIDDDKSGPLFAALQSVNLLLETETGQNYTWGEYEDWMSEAGFKDFSRFRMETTFANGVLVGHKK